MNLPDYYQLQATEVYHLGLNFVVKSSLRDKQSLQIAIELLKNALENSNDEYTKQDNKIITAMIDFLEYQKRDQ